MDGDGHDELPRRLTFDGFAQLRSVPPDRIAKFGGGAATELAHITDARGQRTAGFVGSRMRRE